MYFGLSYTTLSITMPLPPFLTAINAIAQTARYLTRIDNPQ